MVLLTWATGYVGRQVVARLASKGYRTRAFISSDSGTYSLPGRKTELFKGSLLDYDSIYQACQGVEGVIHLGPSERGVNAGIFHRMNYCGTKNLLSAATSAGVRRFIYCSVIGATSSPSLPYMNSRWMVEQEIIRSQIPHVILRRSVGFGNGDDFLTVLGAQVKLSPLIPVAGDGKYLVQPIAVEDLARCLVMAYESERFSEQTIEVGGPEYFTFDQVVDLVSDALGTETIKVHVPVTLASFTTRMFRFLMDPPHVMPEQLEMIQQKSMTDLDSVCKKFGFVPNSLRDGLGHLAHLGLMDALKINLGLAPRQASSN